MRAGLAALALAALALAGCSHRDRANLLDPGNPVTEGRPIGFTAIAKNQTVTLQWQPIHVIGLQGYRIFRRAGVESTYTALTGVLSASTSQFADLGLQNGVDHRYRIYYVLDGVASGRPAEAIATPGPQLPWVSDLRGGQMLLLSPDARNVQFRSQGLSGPTCVDVDPGNGTLWFSDTFGARVGILVSSGAPVVFLNDFDRPAAIAIDRRDHGAWIADEVRNVVFHYRANGDPGSPAFLAPFDLPIALAVDPNDGALYVCESGGGRVRGFSASGGARWTAPMDRPSRVAVDSTSGDIWVTSLTHRIVVRFDRGGTAVDTLGGFAGPIGVAVDARRGHVWVADAAGDRVMVYDRLRQFLFSLGGLGEVREIAIDAPTGDAWVTAPGDGAVVRISSEGAVRGGLSGITEPYDVAVYAGR